MPWHKYNAIFGFSEQKVLKVVKEFAVKRISHIQYFFIRFTNTLCYTSEFSKIKIFYRQIYKESLLYYYHTCKSCLFMNSSKKCIHLLICV